MRLPPQKFFELILIDFPDNFVIDIIYLKISCVSSLTLTSFLPIEIVILTNFHFLNTVIYNRKIAITDKIPKILLLTDLVSRIENHWFQSFCSSMFDTFLSAINYTYVKTEKYVFVKTNQKFNQNSKECMYSSYSGLKLTNDFFFFEQFSA